MGFIDRPQTVWLRRALFQVHLWLGVALAIYFTVIGVTGSVLVFREELDAWLQPALPPVTAPAGAPLATLDQVVDSVHRAFPGRAVFSIRMPYGSNPRTVAYIEGIDEVRVAVILDPHDARVLKTVWLKGTWVDWTAQLHINLLGGRTGLLINGVGAVLLLVLCLSGAVIWWPGIKSWTRALTIDLRRGWRRINFDLHSAVGIWTLLWVAMWSVTTIYFVWPGPVTAVVKLVSSPTPGPRIDTPPRTAGEWPALDAMVARARALYPGDRLAGAFLPGADGPLMLQMARRRVGDFTHTDFVYFDPSTGRHLGTYRRGYNETLGDWIVWLMYPLHFGSDWGLAMKVIWAAAGLSLPVLSITGVLMYWNRYLRKKWRQLTASAAPARLELGGAGRRV